MGFLVIFKSTLLDCGSDTILSCTSRDWLVCVLHVKMVTVALNTLSASICFAPGGSTVIL